MFRLFVPSAKLLAALMIGSGLLAIAPVSGHAQTPEERQARRAQRMEQRIAQRAVQQQERVIQHGSFAAPPSGGQSQIASPAPVYLQGQQGQMPKQQHVAPAAPVAPPAVVPGVPSQVVPPGRLSPEERRELRRQIREHGRDLYGERRR